MTSVPFTISGSPGAGGGGYQHMEIDGGIVYGNSATYTFTANFSASYWVIAENGGKYITFNNTFTMGGFTATCGPFASIIDGIISTRSSGNFKYFPGTLPSLLNSRGDYDGIVALDPKSRSANYTTIGEDASQFILHPSADTTARTFTIDSNANVPYPIGCALNFVNQNGAGVITIAITADTMRLSPGGTTGSRTLAANGMARALKITATEWIISGTGLT
jgi:hypothetical protein